MVKNQFSILSRVQVAAKDSVVAVHPVLVELLMGSKVAVDNADRDSIDLKSNTHTALTSPISSKPQPCVLSFYTPEMRDMLDKSKETENNSNQSDGANLYVAKGGQLVPQRSCPGVLTSKQVISQKVL